MSTTNQWQYGLHNSKDRDNALFLNERLSDLTIILPFHKISFPAHRLMMAKTSPYFENLFYGPMAMHDQEWKIKDDVDPKVFKVVLAHCYDVNLLDDSLDMTLQVYKLADCYMIDSLKSECLKNLQEAIVLTDHQCIIEWSTKYGFTDIEDKVFEILSTRLNLTDGCLNNVLEDIGIHEIISNLLLNLPFEKHKELLNRCDHLDVLLFEESWRHPENVVSCEVLKSIFESSSCKNACENNFALLKGCISPEALNYFINIKRRSYTPKTYPLRLHGFISLLDLLHSQALYECIKDQKEDDHFRLHIHLHIPCNKISPESLKYWSSKDSLSLYLSNVDDQSVPWAVSMVRSLNSEVLFLPKSSLSVSGFKSLIIGLESVENNVNDISICSCNMGVEYMREHNTQTKYQIWIHESDEDFMDW